MSYLHDLLRPGLRVLEGRNVGRVRDRVEFTKQLDAYFEEWVPKHTVESCKPVFVHEMQDWCDRYVKKEQ